ncbi:ATP-binding protein [Intestinibacter sp.]
MKIGIYGVSRSGKSYLIEKVQQSISIKSINGSQRLSEIAGVSIEDFKRLDDDKKEFCRKQLINQLKEEFSEDDLIVDGHYCFRSKNSDNYEIVFTKEDLDFYDVFLYLDTPSEEILKRFRTSQGFRKDLKITQEQIYDWKAFEIEELKKQCRSVDKDLIIMDDDVDENVEWIKLILKKDIRTSSLAIANEILDNCKRELDKYDKVMLLDCDKTLSVNDSTIDFFKYIGFDSKMLKQTFNKDRYSLFQFNKVAAKYSSIKRKEYEKICKYIAKNKVVLAQDTINYIKSDYAQFLSIGITSGIKDVWLNVKDKIGFPNIIVGGNYLPHDRYIMSDDVKRIIAKKLKSQGKYVVALGDSMVDMPMLLEANEGYIVAYEKLNNSVQVKLLKHDTNIKMWIYSKQHYKGIK